MKKRLVTWAVIDRALFDSDSDSDEPLMDADPSEWGDRQGAEDEAADLHQQCGGTFLVIKITREIVGTGPKKRAAIAKARGGK